VDTETLQTLIDTATDRDLLVLLVKTTGHLDEQLHEVRQFIDDNSEALARAQKFLHNPVTEYLATRKAGK
jgi:fructose-specific component phosphotransferase system IIB-like protein